MTPTAFSLTRLQKSCTTSKPTSASSSAVRTSLSASSTVVSSSSASPWNRCLAARNPLVSVSNIGRRENYHTNRGSRGRRRLGLLAAAAGLVPPGLPAGPRPVAFAARQIEVIAEVLAGQLAQFVLGRGPDLGLLVTESLEQPFDEIV